MALTQTVVTGSYLRSDGSAAKGRVTFKLSHRLQDTADDFVVVPSLIVMVLDTDGAFSTPLYATDSAGVEPVGAYYTVVEDIDGIKNEFNIEVPEGSAIDLADLGETSVSEISTWGLTQASGDAAYVPAAVADAAIYGDGVTDATAHIQGLFAQGVTVHLPPTGSFLVDALTVTQDDVSIISHGGELKARTNTTDLKLITVSGDRFTLSGVKVNGDSKAVRLVELSDDTLDARIVDCEIHGAAQDGSDSLFAAGVNILDGCHRATVMRNRIYDITADLTGVARGVRVAGTTTPVQGVRIEANSIESVGPVGDGDGVVVQDWTDDVDVVVAGNNFRDCKKRSVKIQSPGCVVIGNTMTHDWDGVARSAQAVAVQASNTVVSSNRVTGAFSGGAVEVQGAASDNVVVSNNVIHFDAANCGANCDGFAATVATKHFTITGNVVQGINRHGVRIGAVAFSHLSAIGNVFKTVGGSVFLLDAGASAASHISVTGNTFESVTQYFIHDNGGSHPTEFAVVGNVGSAAFGTFGGGIEEFAEAVGNSFSGELTEQNTFSGATIFDGRVDANDQVQFLERSDPTAPASNKVRLYAKDNGSGKTQLVARFPTGAVQVIATEP